MRQNAIINPVTMGRRIRSRRWDLELTQERLAEIVDVSASFMGAIERGEKIPSAETLMRIAMALRISVEYLALGHRNSCGDMDCRLCEEIANVLKRYV